MIQIQGREMFKSAAARIQKERMAVKRFEPAAYNVTNRAKGRTYFVRFTKIQGQVFGQCDCEAGTPKRRNARPVVCKHLLAAVITHNALNYVRRSAATPAEAIPVFDDSDDPETDPRSYRGY